MIKLYGIANCSTVKKARFWLEAQHINTDFIDFKKVPPTEENIQFWLTQVPKEILINRKGITWRKLTQEEQQLAQSHDSGAIKIMCTYPSVIKRPVLVTSKTVTVGFDESAYSDLLIPSLKK